MSSPGRDHWVGVKRILRYLKGTSNFGLRFSVSDKNPQMFGFSDADWAGDVDTRHSTSGHIFQIGNSTVSLSSKMQATVAKSTTEAEYIALSQATQEAVWLRCLLLDIQQIYRQVFTKIIKEQLNFQRTQSFTIEQSILMLRITLFERESVQEKYQ